MHLYRLAASNMYNKLLLFPNNSIAFKDLNDHNTDHCDAIPDSNHVMPC
jgi:hypothetical protein